jgi:hypothetical protein
MSEQQRRFAVSAWAIRNPIPIAVLFIAAILAGLVAYSGLPIKNFPNIQFPAVSVTVSGAVSVSSFSTLASDFGVGSVALSAPISDTAANVQASLDALQTSHSYISAITLTDGGTPNLTITYTQFTTDTNVIAQIEAGSVTLTVTGVAPGNVATVVADIHVTHVGLKLTASTDLSGTVLDSHVNSIDLNGQSATLNLYQALLPLTLNSGVATLSLSAAANTASNSAGQAVTLTGGAADITANAISTSVTALNLGMNAIINTTEAANISSYTLNNTDVFPDLVRCVKTKSCFTTGISCYAGRPIQRCSKIRQMV